MIFTHNIQNTSMVYSVQCTMYNVHCTLYIVHCTSYLYYTLCNAHNVQYAMYIMCTVVCTVDLMCTVVAHIVQCTMTHDVACTSNWLSHLP